MTLSPTNFLRKPASLVALVLIAFGLLWLASKGPVFAAGKKSKKASERYQTAVQDTLVPDDVEDLKTIQKKVKHVLKKVLPATVSLRVGMAHGSGVIIRKNGYILTAAHVSGKAGQKATIILADGRTVEGKTLGANKTIDSGLIKITDKGRWPTVKLGNSSRVKKGQWCISAGHPGGHKSGRTAVIRLGRVLEVTKSYLCTDCPLVGGDSGGPVFDLGGRVIGIHSCIGNKLTSNIHVPVNTYRKTWKRLAKSEVWGKRPGRRASMRPYFGVEGVAAENECKIFRVEPGSPADLAGLQANDIVTSFDGKSINNFDELSGAINQTSPGERVTLEVVRDRETRTLQVVVGRWQE
jgi:serine protease Do